MKKETKRLRKKQKRTQNSETKKWDTKAVLKWETWWGIKEDKFLIYANRQEVDGRMVLAWFQEEMTGLKRGKSGDSRPRRRDSSLRKETRIACNDLRTCVNGCRVADYSSSAWKKLYSERIGLSETQAIKTRARNDPNRTHGPKIAIKLYATRNRNLVDSRWLGTSEGKSLTWVINRCHIAD